MSQMEIYEQNKQNKIPLYSWDYENLRQPFQKTSMEIFHINQVRLIELQEKLNASKIKLNQKQIIMKVYSIFQDMSIIFKRLGLIQLYSQIKLAFNTICRFSISFTQKQKGTEKNNFDYVNQLKQNWYETNNKFAQQEFVLKNNKKSKWNKLGGIFLYNQSYFRTLQKNLDNSKNNKKENNTSQLLDDDPNDQILRKQMAYYLERKKQLTILKVKDNSKKYKQIQSQFKMVQDKLKYMIESLQLKFQNEAVKDHQYLSKQQINNQLVNYNISMRSQLVVLKEQYSTASQFLRQQNIFIRTKLNQQLAKKNSLISTEVQTNQTMQTLLCMKKIKKIVQQYQMKLSKSQIKIQQYANKEKQLQNRHKQHILKKQKQIANFYQSLYKKEDLISNLKKKCLGYEQIIKKNEENLVIYNALKNLDQETKQLLISELTKGPGKQKQKNNERKSRIGFSFLNKLSVNNRNTFKQTISKFSRFSHLQKNYGQINNIDLRSNLQSQNCVDSQINQNQSSKFQQYKTNNTKIDKINDKFSSNPKIIRKSNYISNIVQVLQNSKEENRIQRQKQHEKSSIQNFRSQLSEQQKKILNKKFQKNRRFSLQLSQSYKNQIIKDKMISKIRKFLYEKDKDFVSQKQNGHQNRKCKLLWQIKSEKYSEQLFNNNSYKRNEKQNLQYNKSKKNLNGQNLRSFSEHEQYVHMKSKKNTNISNNNIDKKNVKNRSNTSNKTMIGQNQKNYFLSDKNNKFQHSLKQDTQNELKNKKYDINKKYHKRSLTLNQNDINIFNKLKNQEVKLKKSKYYRNQNNKEMKQEIIHEFLKNNRNIKCAQMENLLQKYQNIIYDKLANDHSLTQEQLQKMFREIGQLKELQNILNQQHTGISSTDKYSFVYAHLVKTHQLKCKSNSCNHLQSFMRFCSKLIGQSNTHNGRQLMKLHIENFQNV